MAALGLARMFTVNRSSSFGRPGASDGPYAGRVRDRRHFFQTIRDVTISLTRHLLSDERGRALAYRLEFYANIGAQTVAFVTPANAMRMLTTVYNIPVAHGLIHAIVTNTVPTAPYRGAGRPEANHFIERMLDLAAHTLNMDRAEIGGEISSDVRHAFPQRNGVNLRLR